MRFTPLLACAFAGAALARDASPNKHVRKMNPPNLERRAPLAATTSSTPAGYSQPKASIIPETEKTKAFKVNGSAIPDVDFELVGSCGGGVEHVSKSIPISHCLGHVLI